MFPQINKEKIRDISAYDIYYYEDDEFRNKLNQVIKDHKSKRKSHKKDKSQNYDNSFQNISDEFIKKTCNLMFRYYDLKYY